MPLSKLRLYLPGLLLVWIVAALAQTDKPSLQTDWMELVKGYKDTRTGAELRDLQEDDQAGGGRTVTLAIPKTAIGSPADVEEVLVIGRKPEKPQPLFDVSYEWVSDYDADNYGLVIRLSKDSNWPIRLFFYSDSGFTH